MAEALQDPEGSLRQSSSLVVTVINVSAALFVPLPLLAPWRLPLFCLLLVPEECGKYKYWSPSQSCSGLGNLWILFIYLLSVSPAPPDILLNFVIALSVIVD